MTTVIRTKCCEAPVVARNVKPPPPPGALLAVAPTQPEEWSGHVWVCEACGAEVGFAYNYGTIDLGLVE